MSNQDDLRPDSADEDDNASLPRDEPEIVPFSGAEATLMGLPRRSSQSPEDEVIEPFSGSEATLIGAPSPSTPPPIEPFAGTEATLVGGSNSRPSPAVKPFVGAEATLVGGETPSSSTPFTGAEATLVGGETPPPVHPFSGAEATLVGGESPAPSQPFTGAEATLVGGNDTQQPFQGAEATLVGGFGAAAENAKDETQATLVSGGTPATFVGRPRTGGTSTGFDASWHLKGRKGPHTGQTWGDFELGGILGEGGMGAVYRGVQISLKRRVAVKVLPPNLAQDRKLLERFRLEAGTSSRLQSPHVVQVYFIGEQDDNHFYAMEYVDGTDLSEIAKERKEAGRPLTPDESAGYMLQAARGLAEASRIGIVHRDIKPANMMVTKDGLLKLADFGIVKIMGESSLTLTGQAVGTPAYVSPEQGKGESDIDQRSDLYSLGVVFYELACGKRPFEAATPNALIYKHCFDEPVLPKQINPEIPDEIQAMIMRCLQKKPENRYQHANELVRDLELLRQGALLKSALANYKLGTGADEAKREQMTWLQRNLLPVSAAALLLIGAGVTGGYLYIERGNQARNAILQQQREQAEIIGPKRLAIDQILGAVTSVPTDIEQRLAEYADLAPDDAALPGWRSKVARVRALQAKLSVLDGSNITAAVRAEAVGDLAAYVDEVGAADPQAAAWTERLAALTRSEEEQRSALARIFSGPLNQEARVAAARVLDQLANLVVADDRDLSDGRDRIAAFDQEVTNLRERLAVLDGSTAITEQDRQQLLIDLGRLEALLGSGDAQVRTWNNRLSALATRISDWRGELRTVFAVDLPPLPAIDAVSPKLGLLAGLVGEDDPDVRLWRVQAEASRNRVTELRDQLRALDAALPEDRIATLSQAETAESALEGLRPLIGGGDAQVSQWQQLISESRGRIAEWRRNVSSRLDPSANHAIGLTEQIALDALRQRLTAKGASDAAEDQAWRDRLAGEAQRVSDLRARLATVLDRPSPVTDGLEADLRQFLRDVPNDDAEGRRWAAKLARITDLREQLRVLDERRPVPEGIVSLFDLLIAEVGPEAAEIQRWQEKVRAIEGLHASLAPLDQRRSLPEAATQRVDELARLVGDDDPGVRRYRAKISRVGELEADLAGLPTSISLSREAHATAHARLAELVGLLGGEDAVVIQLAARLRQLDGPPKPSWASDEGRDLHGRWADLVLDGNRQRFRYLAAGLVDLGSEANEIGREADEVMVPVRITRGFWLADTELTQALWSAVMPVNPSRFADPQRPVERLSRSQALDFIERLSQRLGDVPARLPTEAEWEYAARAGSRGRWWLPTDGDGLDAIAWHRANASRSSQPVAGRYPNPLGLFDLHGNVAEWVADGYAPYPTSLSQDHLGRGSQAIARGGSWGDAPERLRAANRTPLDPSTASAYLGLRLAVDANWGEANSDGSDLIAAADPESRREQRWRFGDMEVVVRLPAPRRAQTPAEPVIEPEPQLEPELAPLEPVSDPSKPNPTEPTSDLPAAAADQDAKDSE